MSTERMNLNTKEGWESWLDGLCTYLSDKSKDSETQVAECNLVLTANPETGEAWGTPGVYCLLTKFHGSTDEEVEACKDYYVMNLRMIAIAGLAIGSAFLSEAWMSSGSGALKDGKRIQPKDDPERKEGLIMTVQHRAFGHSMRHAFIEHVDGKRVIAEWTESQDVDRIGGRFGGFVPPDSAIKDPEVVKSARAFCKIQDIVDGIIPIDRFIEQLKKKERSEKAPRA